MFGVLDAAKRPGEEPVLLRVGDGGHDRDEPPVSGGTLVVSHTVAGPALWVVGAGRSFVAQPVKGVSRFDRARTSTN